MSNIYDFEEELVPRHRKKSNKKVKKSNHKHVYEPCLIMWDGHLSSGTHCSICGKIGDMKFFETERCEDRPHVHRMLSQKEILEKYKDLECYDYKTTERVELRGQPPHA